MAYTAATTRTARPVSVGGLALAFWKTLVSFRQIALERQALRTLDGDRLADMGLDRDTAEKEAARPFWLAARHWRMR